jgi:hypothetical protein
MEHYLAGLAPLALALAYDVATVAWLILLLVCFISIFGRLRGRPADRSIFRMPTWSLVALYCAAPGLIARVFGGELEGEIGDDGWRSIAITFEPFRDLGGTLALAAVHLGGWLSTSVRSNPVDGGSPDW